MPVISQILEKTNDRTIINYNSADNWPAVKSNYMSKKNAQDMFKAYFN